MLRRSVRWITFAAAALLLYLSSNFHWRHVVHSVPVPGLSGQRVEFFRYVSVLDRDGPVFVRFPNGAEVKAPFFDRGVSDAGVRRASADYDGDTLSVTAGDRRVSVAAYAP